MVGEVTLFKMPEGWGRIRGMDGEVYDFSRDDIESGEELLAKGDRVRFDLQQTEQGPKAVNVCIVDDPGS